MADKPGSHHPLNTFSNLYRKLVLSGTPSRSNTTTAAPEPVPPPPAVDSSTAASTETESANLKRAPGNHYNTYPNERRPSAPLNSQEPKERTRKEIERQQGSSRQQLDMEELLDSRGYLIEVDDDYVEVPSEILNREEQRERSSSGRDRMSPYHRRYVATREKLSEITLLYKEQSTKLLEAEGTIREKEKQITALTETVTRLHLRDGGIARDDIYFTAQFSDITNSITAWTVTHFRKSKWETITDLSALPVELVQMVKGAVYDTTNILQSTKSRREVINAMVINTIYHCLYGPFLFGAPDAGNSLRFVGPQLQGTDFQIQRWRALTVNLLAQGPAYERRYNDDVSSVAASLGNMLAHLAPIESDMESRNADLHKIVDRAAALSVEIRKQSDLIYLLPVQPGMLFKSDMMEDLNCEYELDELEGKAVVQVPIFPAIMRKSCLPSGIPDEPHNLMKARVTTMFVEN